MDLYQSRFAAVLKDTLETNAVERTTALVTTKASTYEDYRERIGFIRGLKYALDQIEAVRKTLDRPETSTTEARKENAIHTYET